MYSARRSADSSLQLGDRQPRSVQPLKQGQGNPSIGIDGNTVSQVGRADNRNLYDVPGRKAVLVNPGKARLYEKHPEAPKTKTI